MEFLKTLKAPSPVFPNDVNAIVSVCEDATVAQGFETLIKHNILAAPVFDSSKKQYCYMFSMRDVLYHALHILDELQLGDDTPAVAFLTEKDHFRNYKVKDIAGHFDKLFEVGTDAPVDKLVELMVTQNVHRIISINPDHSLSNIITQSRVVECLVQLFDVSPSLGALGKQTVKDLQLAKTSDIVSVRDSEKAINAFRKMHEHKVSALPVLDANGRVVGNISESDLKAIKCNAQYLKLLFLPVSEYLEATGKKDLVKCEMIDTYRTVVERVVQAHVHRCYVVDDKCKLIGVVSLHDILRALVRFSSPAP